MADTKWTAIVITCQKKESARAFQEELENRQRKGHVDPQTLLLTVEDPLSKVGSGGATLNALLVVAEHLSQQQGYTVVNSDVLAEAKILILHVGEAFPFDPCGRGFVTLPCKYSSSETIGYDGLVTNIDSIIHTISTKLSVESPAGVWVSSTDMLLTIPSSGQKIDWSSSEDSAYIFAVPASDTYAKNHGVIKLNQEGFVDDIFYKPVPTHMKQCTLPDGKVSLVCGVVFFPSRIAEKLLSCHVCPPLDACTYMGLDSGVKPIQMSLFFDFILPIASSKDKEDYISGERCKAYDNSLRPQWSEAELQVRRTARSVLWNQFRGLRLKGVVLEDGRHDYQTVNAAMHLRHLVNCPMRVEDDNFSWSNTTHCFIEEGCLLLDDSHVINSIVGSGVNVTGKSTIILHSHLQCKMNIAKDSYLMNIDKEASEELENVSLPDSIFLQGFNLCLGHYPRIKTRVYTVMGKFDSVMTPFVKGTSTFCNSPWAVFFTRTGVDREDLWAANLSDYERTLYNAKLFPVMACQNSIGMKEALWLLNGEKDEDMLERWRSAWRLSLEEIMTNIDLSSEFQWRREMFTDVGLIRVEDILMNSRNQGVLPFLKCAVIEGCAQQMLDTLDAIACKCNSAGIAARCLACIADVLGTMAGGKGGLRSGPGGNKTWTDAFQLLEAGKMQDGIRSLANHRSQWLDRPDRLMRAARHYEGATQILIRHAIMLARQFIKTSPCDLPPMGKWVTALCPSRIDLSGGWTDTPPVTYEYGGAVVDAAILLDGEKKIGAKVKRIPEPKLVLVLGKESGGTEIVCEELKDLANYTNPQAPGALLKAAFCCAEVVTFPSSQSLKDQLEQRYGGGFELHTWADLPRGSGLGTSSILAGGVMAALWRASGKTYDHDSLIHAILHLEQMLTTGGGWQDQVGGLTPRINIGRTTPGLPCKVEISPVPISDEDHEYFNQHFILVYTGKTRLARNLLQDVIRNWYARQPLIVHNCQQLIDNAEECVRALKKGDFEKVGECMNKYWSQKKIMAPGSEPRVVSKMMAALKPIVHGQVLGGAGGGGFMYVLTKDPNQATKVREIIAGIEGTQDVTVHEVKLDTQGLLVEIEE
ncbi:L-fucose kinase-like [Lytechinus variegatus]|uniref:L-fucose kinase-like n=1 Tax=Lytechinus variegatus TaxID=7654 RepID=UPI001BB1F5C5|nr:L-fucose kinase-like [Lytechinus variegatus]